VKIRLKSAEKYNQEAVIAKSNKLDWCHNGDFQHRVTTASFIGIFYLMPRME
jgi:hypothetical protein